MIGRALIVVALVVSAGLYTSRAVRGETAVSREPLSTLPAVIGAWSGHEATPFADDVLATLGVDEYVNRQYVRRAAAPLGLYVGYYRSQRQGDAIHSPRNCLPGAGWEPLSNSRVSVQAGSTSLAINQYIIQKGLDRQVVFYWYQGRGHVIAGEYTNKFLLMFDAARLHRTDGGLVRVIAPVETTIDAAARELSSFTATLYPFLSSRLP